ncbi:MAG TPA: nuclear transport factor 2 family protein [Flavisolibacter sp.]|nr:nuclear transport factor 2 family protein [Flavisolibacter sp.]
MKIATIFIIIGLCSSISVQAQVKETILKSVHDDGKTMQLKLTVALPDTKINYDQKFDVQHLSKDQKDEIVNRVIDSLGANKYFTKDVKNISAKATDKEMVAAAVRDYVEALYEADTAKIERSVAKHLSKRGYYSNNGVPQEATMSYDQLMQLTKRWKGNKVFDASTPKKIVVLDVLDKIASAKLEAQWGIDYFHLSKEDGKWMIVNVLWQAYPSK